LAIASYLETHDWKHQIGVFRELYMARRDATVDALADLMPRSTWNIPSGGFYVWVGLPDGLDAKAMLPRAVTERVAYVPGTAFFADGQGHTHLRLSYCYPTPDRIREGVRRLAGVIDEELEVLDTFGGSGAVHGGDDDLVRGNPGLDSPTPDLA
jgi:DNA-binding transcriptional MocR family regulator